jgi:predicted dehydrogenase
MISKLKDAVQNQKSVVETFDVASITEIFMYNAAIIGISGFGNTHYVDLKHGVEDGRWNIVGATVINQTEEVEKCDWLKGQGTELYTDWQLMLDELAGTIDICFIPTGINMHAPMSIAAMRAGANVFVEKPAAATVQEVAEMQRVADETGKFVAVGYQFIYQPDIAIVKQMLIDGKLGKITSIKSKALWSRDSIYYNRNGWAGKLNVNGDWVLDSQFNNANAHFLNVMNFLGGKTFSTAAEIKSCYAELYRAHAIESPDTACLQATSADGVELYFFGTHACFEQSAVDIIITGELGMIEWRYYGDEDIKVILNDGTVENYPKTPSSEYRQHVMAALEQRLIAPDTLICDLKIAGEQTLWNNGAYESSAVNQLSETDFTVDDDGERIKVEIYNINDIISQSFEQEKMFSELNVPWAVKGTAVDLTSYKQFNGGKI